MNMEVILDRTEETSISIDGDFEKNSYSKNLKLSFFQALAMNTKLSDEIKFMPGMSGKKYRYFINNFVSQTDNPRYLEIGSWTGSTVCSALYGNAAKAVCIDNWLKFPEEEQVSVESPAPSIVDFFWPPISPRFHRARNHLTS